MRPKKITCSGRQLGQVFGHLRLGIAPGEIGVRLRKAELGQPVHRLRPGERLAEEDCVGKARAHFGDQPFPERQWLGVRIVDAEQAHAVSCPEQDDVAQRQPQGRHRRVRVKIDVDDVLVFFRRVFGVADRAVRPPLEPVRVLAQPGVVRRTLHGEIERNFEAVRRGRLTQATEVVERAESGIDRVVAALGAADRIGAAGIARRRAGRIVAALAVGPADRVDRREIEHVEAHIADRRQPCDHVIEGAGPGRIAALRPREQLIPAGKPGGAPLGVDGQLDRVAARMRADARRRHPFRRRRGEQQTAALVGSGA